MSAPFQPNPRRAFTQGSLEPKVGSGIVFGKFMPPHDGHMYLLNFARRSCHRLTIMVCSLENEPIPGEIRFAWVKRLFPDCNVVHHYAPIAQLPEESPTFFTDWAETIRRHCPGEAFDVLFASEPYGYDMAAVMGVQFIPVDERRELVPISGTLMRNEPMKYWQYLNPVVRPYFVKRVAVVGPESCGKTTLTAHLAEHFSTVQVHEYARDLLENYTQHIPGFNPLNDLTEADFATIARGQAASTEALAEQANRVLICDTDLITTEYFAHHYLGHCPSVVEKLVAAQKIDCYLLLDPEDIEAHYTPDTLRDMPDFAKRKAYFLWWKAELQRRRLPFQVISGASWAERNHKAKAAVQNLIGVD